MVGNGMLACHLLLHYYRQGKVVVDSVNLRLSQVIFITIRG